MKAILLLGLKGTGKSVVANYLSNKYKLPIHKLGKKIRDLLSLEGKVVTEEKINERGKYLKENLESHSIGELYLEEIKRLDKKKIVVVDSPRDIFDIKFYEGLFQTYSVGVFTEKEGRYDRLLKRKREGDALTIEGIIKEDKNQASNEAVNFMLCDYLLLNQEGKEKEFYEDIEKIFKKIKDY